MGIGTSLFLIAVGAILTFAVDADVSGIEIATVGIILMIVGVIGLLISLLYWATGAAADGPPSSNGPSCAIASTTSRLEPCGVADGVAVRRAHLACSTSGRCRASL